MDRVMDAFKEQLVDAAKIVRHNPLLYYAVRTKGDYTLASIEMRFLNSIHLDVDNSDTSWNESYANSCIPLLKRV